MNLGATLTHKVGPMPMGAWLLVGVGGLLIARKQQQKGATAPAPTTGDPIPTGGGYGVQGGSASFDGAPVVLSPVIINKVTPPASPAPVVNVNVPAPVPAAPAPAPGTHPRTPVPAKPKAPPKVSPTFTSYTVRSGDTLWGIAASHMGSGLRWATLYSDNAPTIEAAARAHHYPNSAGGHWIFPGTTLRVRK